MMKEQEYYTEKLKEFKEEHKKKGLCIYCNNKAVNGRTMCKYHLNYHKFYKKFKVKGGKKK